MFDHDLNRNLQLAAADVLETMFFAAAMPLPMIEAPAGVSATVHFSGTHAGALSVSLEEDAARAIAGNFLGVEEAGDIEASQVGEVVCEMTNMLCGALLSRWNANGEYSLDAPRLGETHGEPWTAACNFDTGAGAMSVTLSVAP